jgi:hypothetical protein
MASFTTRVQLNGTAPDDYVALHTAMQKKGFLRTIVSNDGVTYELPHAEYNLSGNYDRNQVLHLAKDAMSSISKGGKILVTESAGRTWDSLEKKS